MRTLFSCMMGNVLGCAEVFGDGRGIGGSFGGQMVLKRDTRNGWNMGLEGFVSRL